MHSIPTLVKTELRLLVRSRIVAIVTIALAVLTAGGVVLASPDFTPTARGSIYLLFLDTGGETALSLYVHGLVSPGALIFSLSFTVPLLGLLIGFGTLVSERESDRIRVPLSMPCSRRDLLVGKLLGRVIVVGGAIGLALTLAAVLIVSQVGFGAFSVPRYLAFVAVTMLYGSVFVALGCLVSSLFATTRRAAIATVCTYLFVTPLGWAALGSHLSMLPLSLRYGFEPSTAYAILVAQSFDALEATVQFVTAQGLESRTQLEIHPDDIAGSLSDGVPLLLRWPASVVILLGWAVVPAALAYYTFDRTDFHQ